MKTAVIWNESDDIKYLVVNDDLAEFNGVYINDNLIDQSVQNGLLSKMYDDNNKFLHKPVSIHKMQQAIVDGAYLIECGFLP